MTAYDGFEPTWELQAQVNADMARIEGYGKRHSDLYGGSWLQDRHLYAALFIDSVDDHTEALTRLVAWPERLHIGRATHSLEVLRDTAVAIRRAEMAVGLAVRSPATERVVVGVAPVVQRNLVEVRVQPGHPEVEARLRATYGSRISVELGQAMEAL